MNGNDTLKSETSNLIRISFLLILIETWNKLLLYLGATFVLQFFATIQLPTSASELRKALSGLLGNLVKKFFQPSKCSLLGRKSNIAKSQFLKIWFFDLHFICLRKQQSKFDHFWANSNYGNAKNREIRPQGLDLGGSTASNWRFSITIVIICPKMIKESDF